MIKGAIFDVDGTLLDSMEIWEDAGIRYLRRIGVMPEEGLSGVLYSMTMSEGAEYVKEHYHLPFSIDEIIQGVLDTVRDFYFYEVLPKSGAKELLSWIKDKNITIAGYFGQIFTCREGGSGKRHPLIYEKAAAYLGWKPEEILVFEDAFYALMTAKKAGFRTVGIYDRFSEGEQEEIKKQADVYLADLIKGPEILAEKEEIRL